MAAIAPATLLLAVPLAVDPAAQVPSFAVKWLLVCGLVPLGLAVTATSGPLRWPAARWWVAWLAVLALSTVVGVAPRLSALGAPLRNVGLLASVLAAGAYVLGASTGRSPVALRWAVRAGALAAAAVGLGALLDRLGVDLFGLGDLDDITRARSTWGSATFAAGHLVLVTPLAVLLLQSADRRWRVAGGASTVVALTGLVLTGTRGAWLGALVAAVVLGWPHRPRRGGRARAVAVAGGLILALGVVAAVSSPSLGRSTGVGRLDLWRVSVAAVAERPLLGAGPDAQRIVLPAAIDDEFEREHSSEDLHDRAHDLVLDTLLTTGVVGAVALGALLVAVGRRVVDAARTSAVGRALAAGLAGYLVHLLTAFSEASLDPLAWLLAGAAVAVASTAAPAPRRRPGRLLVAGACALAAAAGAVWAGGEVVADRRLADALDERAAGTPTEAMFTLDDARATAPARFDILQARARLAEELRNSGFAIDLEVSALADLDAALAIAPGDPDLLIDRASVLASAGRLDDARAVYEAVLAGPYPSSSRAWLGLGIVAAVEEDDAEAERSWARAADLAPKDERPWINLGLLHERAGRLEEAERAFRTALDRDPGSRSAADGLLRVREAREAEDADADR